MNSISRIVRAVIGFGIVAYLCTSTVVAASPRLTGLYFTDVYRTGLTFYSSTVEVYDSGGWTSWNWGDDLEYGYYSYGEPLNTDSEVVPLKCNDDRDNIIAEYQGKAFVPFCESFKTTIGGGFSFSSWTSGGPHTHSSFALITDDSHSIVSHVDTLVGQGVSVAGGTWTLTEGYRCPARQCSFSNCAYPNGRHIFGDAADIDRSSSAWSYSIDPTGWSTLQNYAHTNFGSCVEPHSVGSGGTHIHMDQRAQHGSSCPTGW